MLLKSLKTHASRHVLATLAICTLIPIPAFADTPVFTPSAGWDVGAAQLTNVRGLKPMKLPCVLATEYDNGYVVRFSGGGGKLLALAIDFRQNVFQQGKQYDAMLSLGDGYVKQVVASAFTESTLIFNLRPLGDAYAAVKNAATMEIGLEDNTLKFSLGRIAGAYEAMESCYTGGSNVAPIQPIVKTAATGSAPVPEVEAEPVKIANNDPKPVVPMPTTAAKPLPKNFDEIVHNADVQNAPQNTAGANKVAAAPTAKKSDPWEKPVAAKPDVMPMPRTPDSVLSAGRVSRADDDGMASVAPTPITPAPSAPIPLTPAPAAPVAVAAAPTPMPAPKVWDAKAGEDLKIVLSRWSERAGYDLQWQANQDGKVAQDLKLSGSFEDAVGQLLAENSAATGIGGHVETAGGKKDLGPKVASAPVPQAPPVQASVPAMHDQWSAAPGTNIQSVLDQWSSKAGVAVVWQSYMSVPVKQPVQVSGTYEQAVQTLLDQYLNDAKRPVGQLNVDPESGARTLLMDSAS